MAPETTSAPATTPRNISIVIGAVATLLFLASLDQSVVSTALPTIVADLGGIEKLSWVVTGYILASTIVAPLYGKLGDLFGRRNMVFLAVSLFLVGSLLCGLAQSMEMLVAARLIKGLGGGGLFVLALSVMGDVVSPRDRPRYQGYFAAIFSISAVAGPLVGGWIVEVLTWHWIFFINLPIGLIAILAFAFGFKPRGIRQARKVDWMGAIALSTTLGALILVASLGGHAFAWISWQSAALVALCLAALAAFIVIEHRVPEPLLPPSLFKINNIRNATVLTMASGVTMLGAMTYVPLYLQIAKGLSPTASGLMVVPLTLGIMTASNIAGRYMSRTGHYRLLPAIGLGVHVVAALCLSRLAPDTPLLVFGCLMAFTGLGTGCIGPVLTTVVQNAAPVEHLGSATASNVMFRQIGGTMAVAIFGAIFGARLAEGLGAQAGVLADGGQISPAAIAAMEPAQRLFVAEIVSNAMHPIYWLTAIIALGAMVFSFKLREIPLRSSVGH